MKKFFEDFKAFITKGNVLDLAVGMIIGAAFNAIVKSMVNDLLMPIISLMFKGDVSQQFWVLQGTPIIDMAGNVTNPSEVVLLYWGQFLQSIIDFLIVGFTLFVIVKVVVKFQKMAEERKENLKAKYGEAEEEVLEEEPEEVEEVIPEDILLLREIRDSLTKQNNEE